MSDIVCHLICHSKFIDRDIVFDIKIEENFGHRIEKSVKLRKEFKDLGTAFCLNRVELKFSCDQERKHTTKLSDIRDDIKKFCDTRLEGYWSWKFKGRNDRKSDQYLYDMELFFERKDDMDLWLKDQGMMIKLKH